MSCYWCNGEFLEGKLPVSPGDRGLTHGLGLFETILATDGQPVELARHLARMAAGAERLGWRLELEQVEGAMVELLGRRGLNTGRARLRLAVTAGTGDLRSLELGDDPRLWITAAPCPEPPESVSLWTSPFPRNERSPLAGLKCASYAENLFALDQARRSGADEALFYNTRGELCEAATANVFLVRDGCYATPPLSSGCLPGTMRARVMEQREVEERPLTAADLEAADEVFLSSATRGLVRVSAIDGKARA
ncbi:aminotransferase class IV [Luteolibacter marinus]|uniref:aminotransferase class IV n=1 Tax=Luteolibacter marinus TaxID=2776705 RepID=UPI001867556A